VHRAHGCACPAALPGGLSMVDSREAPSGVFASVPVVHQLFSDGVSAVSLFSLSGSITTEDVQALRSKGFSSYGDGPAWVRGGTRDAMRTTLVWACRGSVLTLVTDDAADPAATARAVLEAFPPDPPDYSFFARVARGWHRLTGGGS